MSEKCMWINEKFVAVMQYYCYCLASNFGKEKGAI